MPTTEPAGKGALTLMSRAYCHLCHDMEAVVRAIAAEFGMTLDVVDVDADGEGNELETRYGELVPVLLHDGRELCHYFVDAEALRAYLGGLGEQRRAGPGLPRPGAKAR